MQQNECEDQHVLRDALYLFSHLGRHGGSMRTGPLLRWWTLSREELCAALNKLMERRWTKVTFRPPRNRGDGPLQDVERFTTTRYGRFRYPHTWSTK